MPNLDVCVSDLYATSRHTFDIFWKITNHQEKTLLQRGEKTSMQDARGQIGAQKTTPHMRSMTLQRATSAFAEKQKFERPSGVEQKAKCKMNHCRRQMRKSCYRHSVQMGNDQEVALPTEGTKVTSIGSIQKESKYSWFQDQASSHARSRCWKCPCLAPPAQGVASAASQHHCDLLGKTSVHPCQVVTLNDGNETT